MASARERTISAILRSGRPASPSARRALAADKRWARSDWPLLALEPECSCIPRPSFGLDRSLRRARYGGGRSVAHARLRATGGERLHAGGRPHGWQRLAALPIRQRTRRRTTILSRTGSSR